MKGKMKYLWLILAAVLVAGIVVAVGYAFRGDSSAADPTGASYMTVTGDETLQDVASTAIKGYFGANFAWVMICAVKSKFVCKFKTCTMHGVPKQRLVVSTDQRQCV